VTAALTWARLSYRQQRWELILVAIGVVLATGGMLWIALQLDAMRAASPDCLGSLPGPGSFSESTPVTCQSVLDRFYSMQNLASNATVAAYLGPLGMGALLGGPLVAREIDSGTAQVAWSLGTSRPWWLARRIAFMVLFVAVSLAIIAVASEILAAAVAPERDLGQDFMWFGRRGWIIVAYGIGALLVGLVIGAVIGRVLPAVLTAFLIIGVAFVGIAFAMDAWNRAEAIPVRFNNPDSPAAVDDSVLAVDYGIELTDGTFSTYNELYQRGIDEWVIDEQGRSYASAEDLEAGRVLGYEARLAIPSDRYLEITARQGAMAVGMGLIGLVLAMFVVRVRRPV
jgi:hypothetical protein